MSFIVCKINNKLMSIYMFNEENNKFLIDESCFYFNYPKNMKMNITEINKFKRILKEYMLYNDYIYVNWK